MVVESTLKFLKTTVAEDAITTEEILVAEDAKAGLEVTEAVRLQEEKVEEIVDLEVREVVLLQEEKADFLTELQDVLKVLEIHQDQEDQEEVNTKSLIFL